MSTEEEAGKDRCAMWGIMAWAAVLVAFAVAVAVVVLARFHLLGWLL